MSKNRPFQLNWALARLVPALARHHADERLSRLILAKMSTLFAELKQYENPNHIFGVPLERYPLIEPLHINPRNN